MTAAADHRAGPFTTVALILGLSLVATSCGSGSQPASAHKPQHDESAARELVSCPVTIPPQPAVIPPHPYPAQPPAQYGAAWYGTTELWTMLDPNSAVWDDLPGLTQKTFWWNDGYDWGEEPQPRIAITARRIDQTPLEFESSGTGTNGYRTDIGSFMLVGIEFPAPGCWDLTASYKGTELSYIVWIAP